MHPNDTAMAPQRELVLNDLQARQCTLMHTYLTEQIAASAGWLSFERFMDIAL
jgi:hypothetical protein